MLIKIDNRETDLVPLIETRIYAHNLNENDNSSCKKKSSVPVPTNSGCLIPSYIFNDIQMKNDIVDTTDATDAGENNKLYKLKIQQLHIGDIVIEDDSGKTIIIFERKTLSDLAASIKDGRYNEQSFRLDKEPLHNHHIVYIIEGDIERYNEKRTRISKKTLISTMFSLLYYKGFSVYRTNTIFETADTVLFFADKYNRTSINEPNRKPFYELDTLMSRVGDGGGDAGVEGGIDGGTKVIVENEQKSSTKMDTDESEKYCSVMKSHKEKNEYITPQNINIIMLSCVPGINSKTATQIMTEYKTIQNLVCRMGDDPNCLNTFMIKMENGNTRKINKNCVDNIKKFLLANDK
jgi:ERCC4-type nuclease